MIVYQDLKVADDNVEVHVCENMQDVHKVLAWVAEQDVVACDTETTGLDIFGEDFRVRTIQFGNENIGYVIPLDAIEEAKTLVQPMLDSVGVLVFQNAVFDYLALSQVGFRVDWHKIMDTKILAHLIDPRGVAEGGPGLGLADLTRFYIDPVVADEVKESMGNMAKANKLTKSELFAKIDIWDEAYLIYAGMDTVLTMRLYHKLLPLVPKTARSLIEVEHKLAEICGAMEHNGFMLDVEYAEKLAAKLLDQQERFEQIAKGLGVENVNSTDQVAAALIERGVTLTERTPSGKLKVDKKILDKLVAEGDELAYAIVEAKKAKKWRTTWVQKFLDNRDSHDRCHANIHPLQARTARMSITGIPAQTLPSSDWMVRRCFVADPGHEIISVDYQTQELRVLAALSGDKAMMNAFATGADLHQMTADASGVDRKVGKTVNFAYVYGSGPKNIAETCGITVEKAKQVIQGFEKTYPGVKRYSTKLQNQARRNGYITTPSGRRIPVDRDRPYAALNYMIQSTSRDITAAALLRLDRAGFRDALRLPIHDEIVACLPEDKADDQAKQIAEIMKTVFNGVGIDTDCEVYGKSWGGGYVSQQTLRDEIDAELIQRGW